jgi:alkylation response protein AidB-like acyl-CoA dehydrogenase
MNPADMSHATVPFDEFLKIFKTRMHNVFHDREDMNRLSTGRGLPPYVLREVMACNPLSVFIPAEYGGRGPKPQEGIAVIEAASYESLALALIFGINWALFLQPVAKYGQEEARRQVFDGFLRERKMGGLMITEPDYGSDALHMQTSWDEEDSLCHLRGTKHWAGLTGWADYWLLTARKRGGPRGLARDIDFFICDANAPGQHVVVEERYNNLGLYMIPYGRNRIDVKIPATHRLLPHSTGIKMMLDLLHRSRMQFPSMAMGFLTRLLDEAAAHARDRLVGGKALFDYDQVQARLTRIQSAFTVCSAMCVNTTERADIARDLAPHGLEANAVKTCITDLMQDAAQSLLQLSGAMGYRLDHIAGRAVVDSRPFQIFEGSNDILYAQITEALLKLMKIAKQQNLYHFLNDYELTSRASGRLKPLLEFKVDPSMAQRKLVELGQAISRIIAMDLVIKLGERGFDKQLIAASIDTLQQEIAGLVSSYACEHRTGLIDPDQGHPSWRDFC